MLRICLLLGCLAGLVGSNVAAEALASHAGAVAALKVPHACGRTPHQRPRIRHVIVIVMENHSRSSVIGHAPFLTALARRCGQATNYWAITHPSLPNYLAMTSGSIHGVHSDCDPTECPIRGRSIFSQLARHHRKWRAYNESMVEPCQLGRAGLYAPKHNPAVYYTRLRGRRCARHVVSLGSPDSGKLTRALNRRQRSPAYMFVTPNLCNDMHSCPIAVGDHWLSRWVPTIVHSRAYRRGHTALFVTFDEGHGGGNQVATIVVSPYTRAGTVARKHFTHYSLLRTTERLLGLRYLGRAAMAHGLSKAFRL